MWPTLPSSDGSAAPTGGTEPDTPLILAVLLQQFLGGSAPGSAMRELARFEATWDEGRRKLMDVAHAYKPLGPGSERSRALYRLDPNTIVVAIDGFAGPLSVTLRLAEFVDATKGARA